VVHLVSHWNVANPDVCLKVWRTEADMRCTDWYEAV